MTIKLNIGSGKTNFGYEWTNIDKLNLPHIKSHDITKLNYLDNSINEIYSSNTLEYFDYQKAYEVLKEWYRVLKVGGIIRLSVPNFDKLIGLYFKTYNMSDIIGPLFGKIEVDGEEIYHKTVFNKVTLMNLLYVVGFKRIKEYDIETTEPFCSFDDQSHAYYPHMDKNGLLLTLNLEAIK